MATAAFLLLLCILAEVVRELCFKTAAGPLGNAMIAREWQRAIASPLIWVGICLWAGETVAWIAALELVPLGFGYPIRAASYALIPFAAWLVLKERLGGSQILGVSLITVGVCCVGLSQT
ncbi:MAG: permease [Rhizorhabdus sp.]|nr:permease [Rhizorhabdus sp.]